MMFSLANIWNHATHKSNFISKRYKEFNTRRETKQPRSNDSNGGCPNQLMLTDQCSVCQRNVNTPGESLGLKIGMNE